MKDLVITDDWVNVSENFQYNPTHIQLSNKSNYKILVNKQATPPSSSDDNGFILTEGGTPLSCHTFSNNSNQENIYARCLNYSGQVKINTSDEAVKRHITSLSAAGGMYYELSDRIVVSSGEDFEFETDIMFGSEGGHILTEKGGGASRLSFASNGVVYIGTVNIGSLSDTSVLADKKLHKMVARQVSSVFTISFDGEIGLTYNQAISVLRIDALGSSIDTPTGIPYFSGILKNAKLWTGGDRNTGGTLVLDLPVDEDWTQGNVVCNRTAQLGDDVWTFGDTTANGTAPLYSTLNGSYSDVLQLGKKWVVTASWANLTGKVRFQVGDASVVSSLGELSNDTGSIMFIASTETVGRAVIQEANFNGTVADNISLSIQEIPSGYPYATAINVTDVDAEKFAKVDDGFNWLGEDIVTNGGFNNNTSWVKGAGWNISSGSLNMPVAQAENSAASQSLGLTLSNKYKVGYELNVVAGDFVPYAGTGAAGVVVSSSGSYTDDIVAGSGGLLYLFGRAGFIGSVDNVSVKRLIPIAQQAPVVN